jgi:3-oxoacyl-[acyl-carrier-protein] synthase-3
MGSVILGTGMAVPDTIVTNADLERIMDTSAEWISSRSGIRERRFADPGVGSSQLAIAAGAAAIVDAGLSPDQIDAVVTTTMTPDIQAPGISALVQVGLGVPSSAAYDLRQQCSGFIYGMDLADSLIATGRAAHVLVVGAEVHAGYLPWDESWGHVLGTTTEPVPADVYERNSLHRAWSVLFGDGAGAMVLGAGDGDGDANGGILDTTLHTDGTHFDLITVPAAGSRSRPYIDPDLVDRDGHLPVMNGNGLYRQAVRRMPEAIVEITERNGLSVTDLDLIVAHQANDRITEGVRRRLGVGSEVVPSNIARYGNTTSATVPILFHELRTEGRVRPGSLICFTAFGAGAHWGAVLYRHRG